MVWFLSNSDPSEQLSSLFGQEQKLLQEGTSSRGRGAIWRGTINGQNWILKPYLRGGLLGKVVKKTHVSKTSFREELDLTLALEEAGVPVSRLRAVSGSGNPGFWQAYGWIQADEGLDGFELWEKGRLTTDPELVKKLGQAIADYSAKGFFHPDLNLGNVFLSETRGWVFLDWRGGKVSKKANVNDLVKQLVRLGRSGIKHLDEAQWPDFLSVWQEVVAASGSVSGQREQNFCQDCIRGLKANLSSRSWFRGKKLPL